MPRLSRTRLALAGLVVAAAAVALTAVVAQAGNKHEHPSTTEALRAAPMRDRTLKLAALEYIVFAGAWDAEHSSPPSLWAAVLPHAGPEPVRHPRVLRAASGSGGATPPG